MKKIKQAAIKDTEGNIHTLPRPARHHTIIHAMYAEGINCNRSEAIQGFILDDDTFIERIPAAILALENGQCKDDLIAPPKLYSEDLW